MTAGKGREKHIRKPSPETKIWRYMDFVKFLSLIHREALFFPIAKKLEDRFEGSIGTLAGNAKIVGVISDKTPVKLPPSFEDAPYAPRSTNTISCWHMNEGESAAMWSVYAARNSGIAVQTTVERLEQSLKLEDGTFIEMGKVSYRPFMTSHGETFQHTVLFFYKRNSFRYEREFRVVIAPGQNSVLFQEMQSQGGINVPVDIKTLIEKIYIAPFTESWYLELVQSLVRDKYHLDVPVIKSELDNLPYDYS